MDTKKHPSASVKPANQFKSDIKRGCVNSGLKTGTISGKASFKLSDRLKLILAKKSGKRGEWKR